MTIEEIEQLEASRAEWQEEVKDIISRHRKR